MQIAKADGEGIQCEVTSYPRTTSPTASLTLRDTTGTTLASQPWPTTSVPGALVTSPWRMQLLAHRGTSGCDVECTMVGTNDMVMVSGTARPLSGELTFAFVVTYGGLTIENVAMYPLL
jgi:hypothetical protein